MAHSHRNPEHTRKRFCPTRHGCACLSALICFLSLPTACLCGALIPDTPYQWSGTCSSRLLARWHMVHLATVSPDADPMPRSVDPSVDALSHATTLRMCARFRKEHFTGALRTFDSSCLSAPFVALIGCTRSPSQVISPKKLSFGCVS
jgi:hypothetical protein